MTASYTYRVSNATITCQVNNSAGDGSWVLRRSLNLYDKYIFAKYQVIYTVKPLENGAAWIGNHSQCSLSRSSSAFKINKLARSANSDEKNVTDATGCGIVFMYSKIDSQISHKRKSNEYSWSILLVFNNMMTMSNKRPWN